MTERCFDFFQDHSRTYLEMAFRTDRQEPIENPDGYGKRTGDCGDTVEMFFIDDGAPHLIHLAADANVFNF